jgi:hypothetical protein
MAGRASGAPGQRSEQQRRADLWDNTTKEQVKKIPLLTENAGPRDAKEKWDTALHRACAADDLAAAEAALAAGADPNAALEDGAAPLHAVTAFPGFACRTAAFVSLLCAAGAAPDARDGAGMTALMHAVREVRGVPAGRPGQRSVASGVRDRLSAGSGAARAWAWRARAAG